MTILLLFINLSNKTRADEMINVPDKTILENLVQNEFGTPSDEDQQLIVETFDREETISAIQQSYLDNLGAFRPQQKISLNAEDEDKEIKTNQDGSVLVKPDIATTKITKRPRNGTIDYKVLSGDTISTIADNFDLNVSTILWENNLTVYSVIRPGDNLRIPPTDGISHQIAKGDTLSSIASKYGVTVEAINEANKFGEGVKLAVGAKLFIPGGKRLAAPSSTAKAQTRYTGFSAISDLLTNPTGAKPAAGNKMNWPASCRYISQYFSWRHTATDIACKIGTPLYAADSGVVEVAGWGTGYGNQIVIDHGGGKKTRYGHMSKFYVKKGDRVTKGQNIGLMGSTGWSTGPHVHFEVIINGRKYNPLNYIK